MFFHSFRTLPLLSLVALVLGGQSVGLAQERSQSLYEKRLSMIRGTSPGIVIYGAEKSAAPASAPATAPVAAAAASTKAQAESKPTAEGVPEASSKSGFLTAIQPPSGRSMSNARRLGTGDEGIRVPTARTALQPAADPVIKP